MHRGTAVRRLRTIAERCQRVSGLWDEEPVLLSAYAFGAVLESGDDLRFVQVAFVLNVPVDELTWQVRPKSCSSVPYLLEIHKGPVDWFWRPAAWPVSNHVIRRPLRIWSTDGPDEAALDALANGAAEPLRLPAPSPEVERAQLATELAASLAHLQGVRDGYWERDWRAAHKGDGVYPENHLWDATHGYLDLLAAVEATGSH